MNPNNYKKNSMESIWKCLVHSIYKAIISFDFKIELIYNTFEMMAYQNVDIKALFSSPSVKDQFVNFTHFPVQATNFEINEFYVVDNWCENQWIMATLWWSQQVIMLNNKSF